VKPTYRVKLIEKLARVADIVSFRFERPPAHRFRAGQWFVLTFPPGAADPLEHHFSYSDSPSRPFVEFTTRLRGSDFKNALDSLPLGSEVAIEGPYGTFVLPAGAKRVAFLTGGIGITCVRSILNWADDERAKRSVPLEEAVLLCANRAEDAVPFREELEELAGRLPGFRVVHVLSHPRTAWRGHRGHLDERVLRSEIPELTTWDYFISGPPSFDLDMEGLLSSLGLDPARIRSERFEGY
jgi:ferredoxin-NADP reductase